jgi:hypothetical protein
MPGWATIITGMAIITIIATTADGIPRSRLDRIALPGRGYKPACAIASPMVVGRTVSITEMRIPFRARTV